MTSWLGSLNRGLCNRKAAEPFVFFTHPRRARGQDLHLTSRGDPSAARRPQHAAWLTPSVSDNTRRAYAGALGQLDAWLEDASLAAYLAELH